MAWNEPGGKDRDPWGGGGGNDGPPDLDEVIKNLQKKFSGIFGSGRQPSGSDGGDGGDDGGARPTPGVPGGNKGIGIIVAIILVLWAASGIYIVQPAERGVVQRLGAYQYMTEPGPHWHLPFPIETVTKVDVDKVHTFPHKAQMLTSDENIVDVSLKVQYRVERPDDYLFKDYSPEKSIRDATETSLREVVGQNTLDNITTANRNEIAISVRDGVRTLIGRYESGLEVVSINIQDAEAPSAVKEAFDDVIKAREDKERFENEAEAYANEIVPRARGAAARQIEDAKAYKAKVIAESEGESARFLSLLEEYQKAPVVTRQRLYLETAEQVFAENSKLLMDTE